jgi:hypothetical protein
LGQGAYLGKKLTTTSTPRLLSLSPAAVNAGDQLTVKGQNFGANQEGSMITMDDEPVVAEVKSWTDKQLKFVAPDEDPEGKPWPARGKTVQVGLVVAGSTSANSLPLKVSPK